MNIKMIVTLVLFAVLPLLSEKIGNKEYKFEKLTSNVYVMHGAIAHPTRKNKSFVNNVGLIVGGNGLIIVDPGSSRFVGQMVLREVSKISKKPIVAIFNSHIHGDHWLGNGAIVEKYPKVKIYGSAKMIERLSNGDGKAWVKKMAKDTKGFTKDTKAIYPNEAVKHLQVINIDTEKFRIHIPVKQSHSNTDIVVEHINTKTFFMGDNARVGTLSMYRPFSSIYGNIEVLSYVLKLKPKYAVPGHGVSGIKNKAIKPLLTYLKTLKKVVKKGYDDEKEDYEIKPQALKALAKYKKWLNFNEVVGKNISTMYLEIEDRE